MSPQLQGLRRKSTVNALVGRRNTIIENRRKSIAPFVSFHESQLSRPPSLMQTQTAANFEAYDDNQYNEELNEAEQTNQTDSDNVLLRREKERPVAGQHHLAHYDMTSDNLQGMSNELSSNIIRNSLSQMKTLNEDTRNVSPVNTSSGSSNANQFNSENQLNTNGNRNESPNILQVQQVEAVVHSSNDSSSTASSVSSNIDFNFDSMDDELSTNGNDFLLSTFQPTKVTQRDSDLDWNINLGETTESPNTGRKSTRL